jgi:acetylornithine deacetylase/succinyl-diaminopimelate desuccinylase-like protein
VPVEGQTWTSDPFALTARDGKLYGRGSCDMKGFIACVLASVPSFTDRPLNEPVHIIISYRRDEDRIVDFCRKRFVFERFPAVCSNK